MVTGGDNRGFPPWFSNCQAKICRRASPRETQAGLNQFQALKLNAFAVDVSKIVLSLLHQPAVFGPTENLGEPHGHFGRYATLTVDEFGKRYASHRERQRRP